MKSYQQLQRGEINRSRNSIFDRDEYACQICGLNFKEKTDARKNIDHIIPRSAIAWSHPFNLQLLCETCNAEKGSEIPTDYWELLSKNTRKTARWFIDQSPKTDSEKEKLIHEIGQIVNVYNFDFEKHYEVFALYYDDEYINSMTGLDLNDPDNGRLLQKTSWDNFLDEIKVAIEEMKNEFFGTWNQKKSPTEMKHNSIIMHSWLKAMAMKLDVINENQLANDYRRTAFYLKDAFRGGISW